MLIEDYDNTDYLTLLQKLSRNLSLAFENNVLSLAEPIGSGYATAYNSSEGFSILLINASFRDGFLSKRNGNPELNSFIFSINETIEEEKSYAPVMESSTPVYYLRNNSVHFYGGWMDSGLYFPPGVTLRAVSIMIKSDYLKKTLGAETFETLLNRYYSYSITKQPQQVIDAGYRKLLNEVIEESLHHPFPLHFIYNRTMLMLERFILQAFQSDNVNRDHAYLKEDEIRRLIKVESMLTGNYSKRPPTINELSKIAAMSPTKLKNDFKALYGIPIHEYYQKHRMLYAKKILAEGEYPIMEIGRMVGYSNLGHFSAAFKKEFDVLPKSVHKSEQRSFNAADRSG